MDIQTMPYSRLDKLEQRIAELERKVKAQENFLVTADRIIEANKNYIAELEDQVARLQSIVYSLLQATGWNEER